MKVFLIEDCARQKGYSYSTNDFLKAWQCASNILDRRSPKILYRYGSQYLSYLKKQMALFFTEREDQTELDCIVVKIRRMDFPAGGNPQSFQLYKARRKK